MVWSNNLSHPFSYQTTFLGLVLLLLLSSGCKSKKLLQTEDLSEAEIIKKFRTPIDYNFFDGKAKVSISSSAYPSQKGNLYLRGQKDSVIWAAVKKLGVEGGRIQIDHQTATILNRLEKTYQQFSLDTLSTLFGVTGDLDYLQAMMFGMPPKLDSQELWDVSSDKKSIHISSMAQNVLHQFTLSKATGFVTSGKFRVKFAGDGEWLYDDYREVKPGIFLPYYRKYDIYVSEDEYLSLDIKFTEITLDEPKALPFSVPSRYTRLP